MPWLSNWFYKVTHKNVDLSEIKLKMQNGSATTHDLLEYIDNIESRIYDMVHELKSLYKKYNITFTGFKSMDLACDYLRSSIKDGSEPAYNNLIKLESMITGEQQRHLALIRMAITPDGKRIMEQIEQNPEHKQIFTRIFGVKNAAGKVIQDGDYLHLWSEIHKLSEYVLINKNKVYH